MVNETRADVVTSAHISHDAKSKDQLWAVTYYIVETQHPPLFIHVCSEWLHAGNVMFHGVWEWEKDGVSHVAKSNASCRFCPSALSPQPWSFLFDKTSHCCHVFSNNAEREALEITAHPQGTIWCLTGKLKGITTKAVLTFYINTKHLPTGPSPVAPSSCLHVALLLPLKHFYFIKKTHLFILSPLPPCYSIRCNLAVVGACCDKCFGSAIISQLTWLKENGGLVLE